METVRRVSVESGLYDRDYYAWTQEQVDLLRAGRVNEIDLANLAEEVEDMGKRQKQAVASNLVVVLLHLLKYRFQPEQRANSWRASIREHRRRLRKAFEDSPSLRRYTEEVLVECYLDACEQAADETGLPAVVFPEHCPFSLDQVLDKDFLPG